MRKGTWGTETGLRQRWEVAQLTVKVILLEKDCKPRLCHHPTSKMSHRSRDLRAALYRGTLRLSTWHWSSCSTSHPTISRTKLVKKSNWENLRNLPTTLKCRSQFSVRQIWVWNKCLCKRHRSSKIWRIAILLSVQIMHSYESRIGCLKKLWRMPRDPWSSTSSATST